MMVRAKAIDSVGALDDGYWMYCEEMDWCRRFARAGWSIYVLPSAQIVHHEAQSSRQRRWASQAQLWRSRFRFYAKHADLYAPGSLLLIRLLVRASMAQRARQIERSFARGEIDGVKAQQALSALLEIAAIS
jgi:GT2 family glycosyltransferase